MCGMPATRDSTGSSNSKEGPYARCGAYDQLAMIHRIISFRVRVIDGESAQGKEVRSQRRRQRQGRRTSSGVQYELVLELAVPKQRVIHLPKPEDFHGIGITYIMRRGAHMVIPRFVAHDDQRVLVTQIDGPRIRLRGRTATLEWFDYEARSLECPPTSGEIEAGQRALFIFEGGAAISFDASSYVGLGMPRPCNNEIALTVSVVR